MSTKTLAKLSPKMPSVFDDYFKPWNEWFENGLNGRTLNIPAVNITEKKDEFMLSLAVPGLKKSDFNIDVNGNMLTISSEKEENKEEKDARFTRKEYNYTSFERCFTIPDEVSKEKIEARYENGILHVALPKKEDAKKMELSKHISVN